MKLFTEREIRATAIFLPLALLVTVGAMLVRPKHDPQALLEAERTTAQRQKTRCGPAPSIPTR